jgi:hypothetical protein
LCHQIACPSTPLVWGDVVRTSLRVMALRSPGEMKDALYDSQGELSRLHHNQPPPSGAERRAHQAARERFAAGPTSQ